MSGLVVSRFGEKASFNANLLGGIIVLLPTLLLPTHALKQRQEEKIRVVKKLQLEGESNGTSLPDEKVFDRQMISKPYLERYVFLPSVFIQQQVICEEEWMTDFSKKVSKVMRDMKA